MKKIMAFLALAIVLSACGARTGEILPDEGLKMGIQGNGMVAANIITQDQADAFPNIHDRLGTAGLKP